MNMLKPSASIRRSRFDSPSLGKHTIRRISSPSSFLSSSLASMRDTLFSTSFPSPLVLSWFSFRRSSSLKVGNRTVPHETGMRLKTRCSSLPAIITGKLPLLSPESTKWSDGSIWRYMSAVRQGCRLRIFTVTDKGTCSVPAAGNSRRASTLSRGMLKGGRGMRVTANASRDVDDSTLKGDSQIRFSDIGVIHYLDHDIWYFPGDGKTSGNSTSSWAKIKKCETTEYTSPTLQSGSTELYGDRVVKVDSYAKERRLHLHPMSYLKVWFLCSPLSTLSLSETPTKNHNCITYRQEAERFNSHSTRPLIDNRASNDHLSLRAESGRIVWFEICQFQRRTGPWLYHSSIWCQRFEL